MRIFGFFVHIRTFHVWYVFDLQVLCPNNNNYNNNNNNSIIRVNLSRCRTSEKTARRILYIVSGGARDLVLRLRKCIRLTRVWSAGKSHSDKKTTITTTIIQYVQFRIGILCARFVTTRRRKRANRISCGSFAVGSKTRAYLLRLYVFEKNLLFRKFSSRENNRSRKRKKIHVGNETRCRIDVLLVQ